MTTARAILIFTTFLLTLIWGPTLVAQALSDTAILPPGTPPSDIGEGWTVLCWAWVSTTVLEWMKRHPSIGVWSERTGFKVQRLVGVLVSCAAALGIHFNFDSAAGVFTVSGLILPSIVEFGKEAFRQFVVQEVLYRKAVKEYRPVTT